MPFTRGRVRFKDLAPPGPPPAPPLDDELTARLEAIQLEIPEGSPILQLGPGPGAWGRGQGSRGQDRLVTEIGRWAALQPPADRPLTRLELEPGRETLESGMLLSEEDV